jgi:hypothetical protein
VHTVSLQKELVNSKYKNNMEQLAVLIDRLEANIVHKDKASAAVSASSVGWHIEHALLVITQIIQQVGKSDPQAYKWKFSLPRILVFTMGKIPRGKAQAPKSVLPGEGKDVGALRLQAAATKTKLDEINQLQPKQFFQHPFFGPLHLKHTRRMLYIHTHHHLRIIEDIVKSA